MVNGKVVKPSFEVKVGDKVQIQFGDKTSTFEIVNIPKVAGKNIEERVYRINCVKFKNKPSYDKIKVS